MPESTDNMVSVEREWLDGLIAELQAKVGAKEIELSSTIVRLNISERKLNEARQTIDTLSDKIADLTADKEESTE